MPSPAFSGPPALSVARLSKRYSGGASVLSDVSFDVSRGEALAIVGANGSGKSTALRCAMRLIEPTSGVSKIEGKSIMGLHGSALRQARSRVGFVFQKHNLSTRLTVLTNVLHGALARGVGIRAWSQAFAPASERARALECLDMVGMAEFASRRADRLSGGQSQRVAIARALMQGPSMLVADEPAASLDPKAGDDVMALFSDLRARTGVTLVFVSHNMEHALRHADRLVGLKNGHLVMDQSSADLSALDLAWLYREGGA